MTVFVFTAAGVVVLGLVVWAGTRMLRHPTGVGGGVADGMGNFIDVFDPARARADRDLKSKDHQGEIIPRPEDDEPPVEIDHIAMTAKVRRPRQAVSPPEE